jgi:hypothetical protein
MLIEIHLRQTSMSFNKKCFSPTFVKRVTAECDVIVLSSWLSGDPRAFDETARLLDIKLDIPNDAAKAEKNRQTTGKCVNYIKELLDVKFQDLVCLFAEILIIREI